MFDPGTSRLATPPGSRWAGRGGGGGGGDGRRGHGTAQGHQRGGARQPEKIAAFHGMTPRSDAPDAGRSRPRRVAALHLDQRAPQSLQRHRGRPRSVSQVQGSGLLREVPDQHPARRRIPGAHRRHLLDHVGNHVQRREYRVGTRTVRAGLRLPTRPFPAVWWPSDGRPTFRAGFPAGRPARRHRSPTGTSIRPSPVPPPLRTESQGQPQAERAILPDASLGFAPVMAGAVRAAGVPPPPRGFVPGPASRVPAPPSVPARTASARS